MPNPYIQVDDTALVSLQSFHDFLLIPSVCSFANVGHHFLPADEGESNRLAVTRVVKGYRLQVADHTFPYQSIPLLNEPKAAKCFFDRVLVFLQGTNLHYVLKNAYHLEQGEQVNLFFRWLYYDPSSEQLAVKCNPTFLSLWVTTHYVVTKSIDLSKIPSFSMGENVDSWKHSLVLVLTTGQLPNEEQLKLILSLFADSV